MTDGPSPRIATLTMNPSIDVHLSTDEVAHTRKVRCSAAEREPGGGGINVARAVHALGGEVVALYPVGGETGELLRGLLAEQGVQDRVVPVTGLTRENVTVFEERSDRQFRFVVPGAALAEDEWRALLDLAVGLAEGVDYLVASGSLPAGVPRDFYARLARAVAGTGTRLCLDTSGEPLAAALDEGVYMIKPNFRELEQAIGRALSRDEARSAACREIVEAGGAEVVALTLEHRGALLVHRGGHLRVPGIPVTPRSTVGAGDSFVAGMVLGLVRSWPLERAFRHGVAAGSAAVLTDGSQLCRREDADRLFSRLESASAPQGRR